MPIALDSIRLYWPYYAGARKWEYAIARRIWGNGLSDFNDMTAVFRYIDGIKKVGPVDAA